MSIKTVFSASTLVTGILCQTVNFHCKGIRTAAGTSSRPADDTKQPREKVSFPGHLKFLLVK